MQGDASQLVGDAAQTLQNTAAGSANLANAASGFPGNVMQALQAYGSASLSDATTAIA